MDPKIFITNSNAETFKTGEEFAKRLNRGDLILLTGELGSGKTTFVKGLAKGLKIKKNIISPTFILLKSYKAPNKTILNHLDLYRLNNVSPRDLGIEELLKNEKSVTIIEWAEKIKKYPTKSRIIYISFKYLSENKREITING